MKNFRWAAIPVALMLLLAACQGGPAATGGPSGTAAATDPTAICDADEFGCVEVVSGDPIVIASALSITGETAFLGNDSNFGIEVAIQDRPEVAGHEVQLKKEDAGCADPADGQTAAQAIIADEQIVGVIGTTCSATAVPAVPVLAEQGITMISPSNTAPSLTNPNSPDYGGKFYARTAYNDEVQGAAVAKFVCTQLDPTPKTAATIHDGSPYAQQLQEVFAREFQRQCSGEITAQEAISVGDTDMHPVLTRIAADKPDFLFFPIFDPEGPLVTQQSQDVPGLENTILAGADGVKDDGFIQAAGELAADLGMYFSGPDLNFGSKYTNEFLPEYRDVSGEENPIAPYHAHAYDAFNVFADAVEAVGIEGDDGTLYIPRTAVNDYVRNLKDFPGLTGTLTCDKDGDCGSDFVSIAQLKPNDAGKLVFTEIWTTRNE
jgi:branched-chain amino acid transport system substrate-binding protein